MNANMQERAERLRALRKRLKLKQARVGAMLGVQAETISSYEREQHSTPEPVWKLIKIIELLGF